MARGIAVMALALALAAMLASGEQQKAGDIIYDEDDGMELPVPTEFDEEAGRERRQADQIQPFTWMRAPFQHATCRLTPAAGENVQGHLYIFQKQWRYNYLKVKGSLWGMNEPKERFELVVHDKAPASPSDCDSVGDTLQGAQRVDGYLGQVKAKGYGRATGFSRSVRGLSLEKNQGNYIGGRSIVVTSMSSRRRVACCAIQEY